MAHHNTTPPAASREEAVTVLFCLVDDAYALLNPRADGYASLKRLADSEVITLALIQQLRGVESELSCAMREGSSRTCSRGWSASTPPR